MGTLFDQIPSVDVTLDITMVDCTSSTLTLVDSAPAQLITAKN